MKTKVIHLKTKKDFLLLLEYFEYIGRKWCSGEYPTTLTHYFEYFGEELCITDENFFSCVSLTYAKNMEMEITEFEDYQFTINSVIKFYLKYKGRKAKIGGNIGTICGYRDDGQHLLIMAVKSGRSGLNKTLFSSLDHILTHKDNLMGYCYVAEENVMNITMEQFMKDMRKYKEYVEKSLSLDTLDTFVHEIKSFKEMFGYTFVSKNNSDIKFIY